MRPYANRLQDVVHLARHGWSDYSYYILCEGEGAAQSWERCWPNTVATCLWCVAGVRRE